MLNISEIYRTFQGEGANLGMEVVIVRFHGCNLSCHFCDQQSRHFSPMRMSDVIDEVEKLQIHGEVPVLITGGEPTVQVTITELMDIKRCGFKIFMETNGTSISAENHFKEGYIDWLTVSPKSTDSWKVKSGSELKVLECVFKSDQDRSYDIGEFNFRHINPVWNCDHTVRKKSLLRSMRIVSLSCGKWKLGIQAHKYWGVR